MNRQNLLTHHVGYSVKCTGSVLSPPSNQQLLIHTLHAYNGSGSTVDIGIAKQLDTSWKLWAIDATTTDVTASVLALSSTSVIGTTNNYGFVAQAKKRFGLMTFDVSQASTGSPVYAYTYWNGSAWTALTLAQTPSYSATGQTQIVFMPPSDWVIGSGVTGADTNKYSIRVLATTAPTQAVKFDSLALGLWLAYRKSIGSTQQLQILFKERPLLMDANESIIPYFSVASSSNSVEVAYQINP